MNHTADIFTAFIYKSTGAIIFYVICFESQSDAVLEGH